MHLGALTVVKRTTEALVNGGCNYNGPKERSKGVSDGQQVNIPVLLIFAMEIGN